MALAHVQAKTVFSGGAGASGFGIVLDSTPTPGNLLLAWVNGFQGFTVGADWTNSGITITDDNSGVSRLLYRYVQVSDDATYSFGTPFNPSFWMGSVVEISGVSGVFAADVIDSGTGKVVALTNPYTTTTGVVTSEANSLAYSFITTPSATDPNGVWDGAWTERDSESGGGYGGGVASRAVAAAATTVQATITWTRSFSSTYLVVIVSLPSAAPVEARTDALFQSTFDETNSEARTTFSMLSELGAEVPEARTSALFLSIFSGPPVAKNRRSSHVIHSIEGTISDALVAFIGENPYD